MTTCLQILREFTNNNVCIERAHELVEIAEAEGFSRDDELAEGLETVLRQGLVEDQPGHIAHGFTHGSGFAQFTLEDYEFIAAGPEHKA